jgi:transcriptional regulator PpsR
LKTTRQPHASSLVLQPDEHGFALSASLARANVAGLKDLLHAASDFSFALDKLGVITAFEVHRPEIKKDLKRYISAKLVGQPWADVVRKDSRAKVIAMLRDAAAGLGRSVKQKGAALVGSETVAGVVSWRQVNYPQTEGDGIDLPVETTVINIGADGEVLVLARDLSATASLQQQLIDTQQTMERDYMSLRFMESRYRAVLQTSRQGVALVETGSLKIVDSNDEVFRLLDDSGRKKNSKFFSDYFDADARSQLGAWLAKSAASRMAAPAIDLMAKYSGNLVRLHASMLRQADGVFHLIWLSLPESLSDISAPEDVFDYSAILEQMPEGFLVVDTEGKILRANAAFAAMAQVVDSAHVVGERVSRWLARSELDFNLFVNTLKQHPTFKQISTEIKGEFGSSTLAEISGVVVQLNQTSVYGLCIRDVSRLIHADDTSARVMPRSVNELKELVGRVSLKDIVGETTHVIEQLCIEAALELTGDNRAAASEMLGLSRQSLYVKLRRFGVDTSSDLNGESFSN